MNRAVKNFVSYLMITMLFILNLLPNDERVCSRSNK